VLAYSVISFLMLGVKLIFRISKTRQRARRNKHKLVINKRAYYVKRCKCQLSKWPLKAKAFKSGMSDSDVASATYTINIPSKVATPKFSPAGGSYSSAQSVALSCATSGAAIRYTTDGSAPSSSSTVYSGPISVSSTTTIKAKGFKSGMTDSDIATTAYTFPGFEVLHHQVNHEDKVFDVQTRSNSSVSSLTFNQAQKRIRLNVDGATGTKGLCEITIPAELLSGDFTVFLDDAQLFEGADFTRTFKGTHNTLSINYDHSSHLVEVFGTSVIPEFEGWLFLPLTMAATLLAFALSLRNKKQ